MSRFLPVLAILAALRTPGAAADGLPGAGEPRDPPQPPAGDPGDVHRIFTEANRIFGAARSKEDLQVAVENYRTLLARGIRNGKIHYNLGCAHLRLEDLGPSILHLRRALLYRPGDDLAAATLQDARRRVPDEFPHPGETRALRTIFFWHYGLSFGARLWLAIIANALFWILFAARIFGSLPFHRTLLGGLLVIGLSMGASAAVEGIGRSARDAVLVAPEVEVRSGNGTNFDLVFARPVHSGVEVRILEERGNWRQVEFPDGSRGWILASTAEPIVPPEGL